MFSHLPSLFDFISVTGSHLIGPPSSNSIPPINVANIPKLHDWKNWAGLARVAWDGESCAFLRF
jgi:hypothetical protein